jgi:adiponectin receptor
VLPRFRTPAWRPVRAGMFVAMGLSAVIPCFDGVRQHGLEQMKKQMGLSWVVLQGTLYILGAGLYAVSPLNISFAKCVC